MNKYAHRGAHETEAENSLAAFETAIKSGFYGIELDVRRLKDSTLVVFHDEKLENAKLCDLTLNELQKLYPDIPTLEDTLKLVAHKIKLDIELKEVGYEAEVINLTQKYIKNEGYIISSFYPKSLKKINKEFPSIKVGLLLSERFIKNLLYLPFFELFVPKYSLLNKLSLLFSIFDKEIIIWDVKTKEDLALIQNMRNVSGIITDNQGLV
ncbi:MAG: glycerophosphodiester phosphodiesterase [bacterium]